MLLISLLVFFIGGVLSLLFSRSGRIASIVGAGSAFVASIIGLFPALHSLFSGVSQQLRYPWSMPCGSLSFELDPLSALFLTPLLILTALASVFGAEYLRSWSLKKSLGAPWFFFNMLAFSMIAILLARNAMLFIISWELMTILSFLLVTFEHEKKSVRTAGWIYLVAAHVGVLFIFVVFIMLGMKNGSMDFDKFALPPGSIAAASLIFVFSIIGFGSKAGFVPLHVWLPEAHPAAPSHVSAIMSGIMIKMGIYGILRVFIYLGPPHEWWGWLLIGVGALSAVTGVLFALAQHDLKRLLAYSTVENAGIIMIGMGTGVLGVALKSPLMAAAGFAGALLHVINHSLFKGLLFLCAGSVLHGTGTVEIDKLGGLHKRMPWTSFAFLTGSVSICGLPPFNGFISEFLIYFGAFYSISSMNGAHVFSSSAVIISLALAGGLALACFTKAFGMIFSGEPRSGDNSRFHESSPSMLLPMLALSSLCLIAAFTAPLTVSAFKYMLPQLTGMTFSTSAKALDIIIKPLWHVCFISAGFFLWLFALWLLRKLMPRSEVVEKTVTWDCGYCRPNGRMQYSSSSFAQPLTRFFNFFLRIRTLFKGPRGIFPKDSHYMTETPDIFEKGFFAPIFARIHDFLVLLHRFQNGRVQMYIMYIAAMLLILLIWKLS